MRARGTPPVALLPAAGFGTMDDEPVGSPDGVEEVRKLLEELELQPLDDVALGEDSPVAAESYGVYVLELESDKFYVGSSADCDARIEQHRAATGAAAWPAVHRFRSVWSRFPVAPELSRPELERKLRRKELGAPGVPCVLVHWLCLTSGCTNDRGVCGHGAHARGEQRARLILHDGCVEPRGAQNSAPGCV